jgi:riboflavin kinase/FMN adenylyltransferase
MRVFRYSDKFELDNRSVVTVGTFDGVHLGHKKIIDKLNDIKKSKKLRSVIVTFDPHPQIVLKNRTKDIKILTTTDEKLELFKSFEIDIINIINFTKEFAKTSSEKFYKTYLIDKIGISELVLGYDHKFGKGREGNIATLRNLSDKYNFNFHRVEEFKINNEKVNSTAIRDTITGSNLEKASLFLGRNYSLAGQVIGGDKRGKSLGYPTANIKPLSENKLIPNTGVYLVSIELKDSLYYGMMNIGFRPTISDNNEKIMEVNIFNFDKDIYDEIIKINFIEKIRDEKKFDSLNELRKQLSADKEYSINKIN